MTSSVKSSVEKSIHLLRVNYTRVAELLLPIVELQKSTQLESESESLSCDMYEALNNVRTMPRASHRDTGKRRVNQVNENSKLKSEVYLDAKAICTEGRMSARLDRV